jgi:hypothetical protein
MEDAAIEDDLPKCCYKVNNSVYTSFGVVGMRTLSLDAFRIGYDVDYYIFVDESPPFLAFFLPYPWMSLFADLFSSGFFFSSIFLCYCCLTYYFLPYTIGLPIVYLSLDKPCSFSMCSLSNLFCYFLLAFYKAFSSSSTVFFSYCY